MDELEEYEIERLVLGAACVSCFRGHPNCRRRSFMLSTIDTPTELMDMAQGVRSSKTIQATAATPIRKGSQILPWETSRSRLNSPCKPAKSPSHKRPTYSRRVWVSFKPLGTFFYQAVSMLAASWSPNSSMLISRILNFWILPVTVIGKLSTNFQ